MDTGRDTARDTAIDAAWDEVRDGARRVLESTWLPDRGFCPPNPAVYPHQWLWDSCFHAIGWAALDDARAGTELATALSGRTAQGFLPHMRYLGPSENRGPLTGTSSFTQPPVHAHAAATIERAGLPLGDGVRAASRACLDWLWRERLHEGLLVIVHPWESGADDAPRWDDWVALPAYDHAAYSARDRELVDAARFDRWGAAVWSTAFVAAPAAFNAFAAHATRELGEEDRATTLAAAIDAELWDEREGLWSDRAVVGGGPLVRVPTLDGALPALVTADERRAALALDRIEHDLLAPYGVRYVSPAHPLYDPDEYWRGSAWPQLDYVAHLVARRWGRDDLADRIAAAARRGMLASGFSEHRNPETGAPLGARPQGWAAVAAALPAAGPGGR